MVLAATVSRTYEISGQTSRDLGDAVRASCPSNRVSRLEVNGQHYWVKRPERMSLRWRLQKGNPHRAFERDRQGLRRMYALGLPVPPIVHEGPDYFVTPDMGISLAQLYTSPEVSPEIREAAIIAAARALHRVHAAGVAHGRPNLKDMLWDGQHVTLIDLERFGKTRNIHWAQVFDFIIFALSCFAVANRSLPQIDQALYLYQTLDVRGVFESAYRSLKWIRWLDPLAKRLHKIRSSRDTAAVLQLFRWMRRQS